MPLSREEQQQLEVIERNIRLEDPAFAEKLHAGIGGTTFKVPNVWVPILLLTGIMLLPVGIATRLAVIAVLGFMLTVIGAYGFFREAGEDPPGRDHEDTNGRLGNLK